MGNQKSFSAKRLYGKDGKLRETAKAFLREIYLEDAGGTFGEDCWTIPGGKANPEGYRYVIWNGRTTMGHRLLHELFNGPIPDGDVVMHSCDSPPCCNPTHLRAGTAKENTAEMFKRGRARSGQSAKTHCPQGHEYNEENTYLYRGHRYCRACHKAYSRDSQRKKRTLGSGAAQIAPRR